MRAFYYLEKTMSWDFCTITYPKARKDYHCQASDCIDYILGWDLSEYEEEDRPTIIQALNQERKILKGTTYIRVTGMWEGEWSTFRARLDLDKICKNYNLYSE